MPVTSPEWLQTVKENNKKWNFPHCAGTCNEKHINSESNSKWVQLTNYKDTFTMELTAWRDDNYGFISANTGSQGKTSNSGIY